MSYFLNFVFIFYIGATSGWVLELIFRRIVHHKWVNPGFLIGPYLPIYGFGLVSLTVIYLMFNNLKIPSILVIILMGLVMTLIELIGGLTFVNKPVKLWDYSNRWGNYKGIICPLFTLIWTLIGAVYYYFIAGFIMDKLAWFNNNLSFSYILGLFTGVIIIDYIYSTKLIYKIRKYAHDNNVDVKLEELKTDINEYRKQRKEKYSFMFPFKQNIDLKEYFEKELKDKKFKFKKLNKKKENL